MVNYFKHTEDGKLDYLYHDKVQTAIADALLYIASEIHLIEIDSDTPNMDAKTKAHWLSNVIEDSINKTIQEEN